MPFTSLPWSTIPASKRSVIAYSCSARRFCATSRNRSPFFFFVAMGPAMLPRARTRPAAARARDGRAHASVAAAGGAPRGGSGRLQLHPPAQRLHAHDADLDRVPQADAPARGVADQHHAERVGAVVVVLEPPRREEARDDPALEGHEQAGVDEAGHDALD